MPLTITVVKKPETQAASKTAVAETELSPMQIKVNRVIELSKAIEAVKPLKKEHDQIVKAILSEVEPEYGATESIQVSGTKGKLQWSQKEMKREITDIKAIHEMLGDESFYKLVSFSLSNVDKYLTPSQKEKVLNVDPSGGSRSMEIFPADD